MLFISKMTLIICIIKFVKKKNKKISQSECMIATCTSCSHVYFSISKLNEIHKQSRRPCNLLGTMDSKKKIEIQKDSLISLTPSDYTILLGPWAKSAK